MSKKNERNVREHFTAEAFDDGQWDDDVFPRFDVKKETKPYKRKRIKPVHKKWEH